MTERSDELPSGAGDLAREYPAIWKAYSGLGEAFAVAGPIEGKALRLVKLALAVGISSEGAVHSHVRRALDEGNLERGNQTCRGVGNSHPGITSRSASPHLDRGHHGRRSAIQPSPRDGKLSLPVSTPRNITDAALGRD